LLAKSKKEKGSEEKEVFKLRGEYNNGITLNPGLPHPWMRILERRKRMAVHRTKDLGDWKESPGTAEKPVSSTPLPRKT